MALTLPRLTASQFLQSATWNSAMASIEAQFALPAETLITWPLTAGGNLDMARNTILNLQELWGIYNLDEFDSFSDAMTQITSDGGGCALIPPDTTISTNGSTIGVDGVSIVGCGWSSVLKNSGGVGSEILKATDKSNLIFRDFVIDCDNVSGDDGLVLDGCNNVSFVNVKTMDCDSAQHAISIVGTSQAPTTTFFDNCIIDYLEVQRCDNLFVKSSDIGIFDLVRTNGGHTIDSVVVTNCLIDDLEVGDAVASPTNVAGVAFDNCVFLTNSLDIKRAYRFSFSNNILMDGAYINATTSVTDSEFTDNQIYDATTTAGMSFPTLNDTIIERNLIHNCGVSGTPALDCPSAMTRSSVSHNTVLDAVHVGMEVTSMTNCQVEGNIIQGAGDDGLMVSGAMINSHVDDNLISACTADGLAIGQTSNGAMTSGSFDNNSIYANGGIGIHIDHGSSALLGLSFDNNRIIANTGNATDYGGTGTITACTANNNIVSANASDVLFSGTTFDEMQRVANRADASQSILHTTVSVNTGGQVTANDQYQTTATLTGVANTHLLLISPQTAVTELVFSATYDSANTVRITVSNTDAATNTAYTGTVNILAIPTA